MPLSRLINPPLLWFVVLTAGLLFAGTPGQAGWTDFASFEIAAEPKAPAVGCSDDGAPVNAAQIRLGTDPRNISLVATAADVHATASGDAYPSQMVHGPPGTLPV